MIETKHRILIIEDDATIAELIAENLQEFYAVAIADSGEAGLKMITADKPQLVILDINLPQVSGISVCETIRTSSELPIIMLSALGDENQKMLAYHAGANDYLVKPPELAVLRFKIDKLINPIPSAELVIGSLRMSKSSRSATLDGSELDLSDQHFDLMFLLARNAGKPVTHQHLSIELRGIDYDPFDGALKNSIKRLRKKLPENFIKSVRNEGYQLVLDQK